MATTRFAAIQEMFSRKPVEVQVPSQRLSELYGINVFDRTKMKKYLSKEAYKGVEKAIEEGTRIDRKLADLVAEGMKAWAVERGATHFTHWFQPLTGGTAEKHDCFLEVSKNGLPFENFEGDRLVQQEPDASSFPNGGIRSTFEARGYTAWDPASPAFIFESTLCIPTIFVSYTGEALDFKVPLLKSTNALDKAATAVCQYFDKNVTKVVNTLGWEQEYFLVDDALYNARPDLMITGRTLMGHVSAKNQQLEDHYFGAIPPRVLQFMREFEFEAFKLGIPVTTRHNEVAPNQFECAPKFEESNLGVDHNQLVMNLMEIVARRHNFRVLLHEKPFKGVNGSGKHNNWSMATNTGVNLLSPGKNPKQNIQFLTFLVNIVKAVYDHNDLLRASIVSLGNSHRLGANEAPPAIISTFLGTQISAMLDEIESKVSNKTLTPDQKRELKLNIGKIPSILLDNTDRNRTSPFAFTGNRFEFRAVGSSANCAGPVAILCTVVANQLKEFKKDVDALVKKGTKKDDAILHVLRDYIIASKKIRFEGNNYSKEWEIEAAKRGLVNEKDVPTALSHMISKKSEKLFTSMEIFSERELHARYEITLESYVRKAQIEGRMLGDLAINHIIPTVLSYQNRLIENVKGIKEIFGEKDLVKLAGAQMETIKAISEHKEAITKLVGKMRDARAKANAADHATEQAKLYSTTVIPFFEQIRNHIDELELIVDDEMWPLPKYRELLFCR